MTLRLFGFKSECIRFDFRFFGGTFAYSADFAYSAKSMVMHRFVAPWMKFAKKCYKWLLVVVVGVIAMITVPCNAQSSWAPEGKASRRRKAPPAGPPKWPPSPSNIAHAFFFSAICHRHLLSAVLAPLDKLNK